MNKKILLPFLLSGLLMTACSTGGTPSSEGGSSEPGTSSQASEPASEASSEASSEDAPQSNILHGNGAPAANLGSLYSLYVDDDTGKIYEKNKAYVAPTSSLVKLAANEDEAKWLYTNCQAGENFQVVSDVADAIRTTLYSTNITLKCTTTVETHTPGGTHNSGVVTFLEYNFGNTMQKYSSNLDADYEDCELVAYSLYDAENDHYQLFYNDHGVVSDVSDWIYGTDVANKQRSLQFITRCFGNYSSEAFSFYMADALLEELANFTITDGVYSYEHTFIVDEAIPLYDQQFGPGNYYVQFSNFEFKVSTDGESLEYFAFDYEYGMKNKSVYMVQDFMAEVSGLRTTSFAIPE